MRRLLGLAAAGLLFLSAVPAATAAAPAPVDPATLTPPPNPNFEWTCLATGAGIACTGTEIGGGVDVVLGAPFECDGKPIIDTFTQTLTARRSHDAAGRETRLHLVGSFDDRWSILGGSRVLKATGRWTQTIDFAVAGDVTSRTITYTGAQFTLSAPGVGQIFHNSGLVKLNWDESDVLAIHGPQDLFWDFDGGIAAACAAMAE